MCDCYGEKCKECEEVIPIHLGDYETSRDEIEVYCKEHIPPVNCRIFVLKEDDCYRDWETFT